MEDFKGITLQIMNAQNEYQQKAKGRIHQQLQQQFLLPFHKDREEKTTAATNVERKFAPPIERTRGEITSTTEGTTNSTKTRIAP